MFGPVRRKSSNVKAMQLFYELKQQFPTLPDHVVSSCIANHSNQINKKALIESLEYALAQQELMGRIQPPEDPINLPSPTTETVFQKEESIKIRPQEKIEEVFQGSPVFKHPKREMNEEVPGRKIQFGGVKFNKRNESVENVGEETEHNVGNSSFYVQRPNTLNLNGKNSERFNNIQPSGKCSDVHKLLNSELVNKPPRSPQSAKRFAAFKNSPTKTSPKSPTDKKETADTPTQTTDTLLGPQNVNLALNVNCSMDVQTPTNKTKCTTSLQVVPQQPWCQEVASPRSFTSVNLTLRPPSSEPQPPIDITSQNSSLTYSTSSFDPQKGLQSKLQITVGPTGGGVSSMRTRPRSSYHPENEDLQAILPANRTGSLSDLRNSNDENNQEVSVIVKQQIRIDKLEIELKTEKCRLVAMQREVASLENAQVNTICQRQEQEEVKQLEKEVKELQEECNKLTQEIDRHSDSQDNTVPPVERRYNPPTYQEQRAPLGLGFPTEQVTTPRQVTYNLQHQQSFNSDGPKWNCHMCTFQNHPLLDRCEQCDMPRILHGKKEEPRNPTLGYQPTNTQLQQPIPPRSLYQQQYSAPIIRNYDHTLPNIYGTQRSTPATFGRTSSPNRTPNIEQNNNFHLQNYPSNINWSPTMYKPFG